MSGLLTVTALLLAGAAPSCDTYTRASANAPAVVHGWLARSADDHVRVCRAAGGDTGEAAAASYSGESAVRREGGVCRYTSHVLTKIGNGSASRLDRYERSDVQMMALAASECPAAHPTSTDAYVPTYDVSARAFEAIMQLWAAVAVSAPRFDKELGCCVSDGGEVAAAGPAALSDSGRRLRGAIDGGRMKAAPVRRIVLESGGTFQHRYALFVANPDSTSAQAGLYVIYLHKRFRGPYHITGVADTN